MFFTAAIGPGPTGDRTGQSNRRGRGGGRHVAIDDAIRLAYPEVLPDQKKQTACPFAARSTGSPDTA